MSGAGVVVVGAGQAGFQTAVSLRKAGYHGAVTIVGDEHEPPYQRPPLSKEMLSGKADRAAAHLRPAPFYAKQAIDVVVGDAVVEVEPGPQRVVLASGRRLSYAHLVLATGARARALPFGTTLRTLRDAEVLRDRLAQARRVTVVGGGFIGLEVAAAARAHGADVTVVEALDRVMARVVSPATSTHFTARHAAHGTRVLLGTTVAGPDDPLLAADVVVAGAGVVPNTELAAAAGLRIADGIVVDAHLRTADPAISAIGDCARFPSPHAGTHVRLEAVQNATDHARCVADRIARGAGEPYSAVPWFWSFQHGARLQIAGLTAGADTTVVRGDPATGAFSVVCFDDGRLCGIESVDRPADHVAARKLLAAGAALTPEQAADPAFELKAALAPAA